DDDCAVQREYAEVLQAMAAALEGAGAKAEESHPAVSFREQADVFQKLVAAATSLGKERALGETMAGTHLAWLERQERRVALRSQWAQWFDEHDILLCPVVATLPFPHDHVGNITKRTIEVNGVKRTHAEALGWTGLIGIVNLPSAVVPIGLT